MHPSIVWIRNDLRLHDNPALLAASRLGRPVVLVFIWSEEEQEPYLLGGASRAWLHDSLIEFSLSVQGKLILRKGKYLDVLQDLIRDTGAQEIFWNRRYEPHLIAKDKEIYAALTQQGLKVHSFIGNVLFEPWKVETLQAKPYQVFTPFYKAILQKTPPEPVEAPQELKAYLGTLETLDIAGLALLTRNPPLDIWRPGEKGALLAEKQFIQGPLAEYAQGRDVPAANGTSRLSSHLHFGEISVRALAKNAPNESFYRELIWREFATHLLYHFPHTPEEPLRKEFSRFPWRRDPEQLEAWKEGKTGYPIVDAGMRELLATGWMHNRVRMIVGSFLVKNLLLSWKEGASWFWEKLFDADLANNTFGWQWVAGSGADAAPYFRIFNPILQGIKFDPEATYIKHWVPELRNHSIQEIHSQKIKGYIPPIVELDFSRMRALEAFQEMKNGNE